MSVFHFFHKTLADTPSVEAFPYTVPKFMPKLLADVLAPRVSDPAPISTTIRTCVAVRKTLQGHMRWAVMLMK